MTPHNDYYLLLLQDFRNATGDFLTPFFEGVSALAISPAIIILCALFYWMIDKRSGMWFFFGYSAIQFVNGIIKLSCCIYRPWIYCPDLKPAGDAIKTALGYSFPSGHSSSAAAIYGTPMFGLWRRYRWASILLGCMILLTMFSRNYLGVHTLQDVLVGGSVSLILVVLTQKILNWVENGSNRDIIILSVTMVAVIASMIYFICKPYPMDYVDGVLLVDPVKMQDTAFMGLGFMSGFVIGWFIDRRFVQFDNSGALFKKILFGILGIAVFGVIYLGLHKVIAGLPNIWRHFIEMTFIMMFIIGLWPIVFKHFVNVAEQEKKE